MLYLLFATKNSMTYIGANRKLNIFFILFFQHQRHVPLVLGFLFLTLPFLPATNLVVTVGFVVAERVLYIPR
jgi:protein O-mannosyl-transferase